jgi:CheY-like chemotaxis protein
MLIEPAPDVCEMLRVVLRYSGYTVQSMPDAPAGLQVLREATSPLTVLFDVSPLQGMSPEQSGIALLDALAQDSREGDGLLRHGYVLMSTDPVPVLATVQTVPASLQILSKPFGLDMLRASLATVDDWLCTHRLPQASTSMGGVARAQATIEASRRLLGVTLDRLKRDAESSIRKDAKDPGR